MWSCYVSNHGYEYKAVKNLIKLYKILNTHPISLAGWLLLLADPAFTLLLIVLELLVCCCNVWLNSEDHCLITSSPWASNSDRMVALSISCNAVPVSALKCTNKKIIFISFVAKNSKFLKCAILAESRSYKVHHFI